SVLGEMGYVRREQRRAPETRSVEVMADQLNTAYAMEILRGVTLAAERLDVDVVVSRFHRETAEHATMKPGDWARRLARSGRSGAIVLTAQLSSEHLAGLAQQHLPVVAIDPLDLSN